ncbi:PQQ-dependent sugar dehydrogenase [bacterium]|nr:PQQ-dependent sugar dehydrogenase [bacterium]
MRKCSVFLVVVAIQASAVFAVTLKNPDFKDKDALRPRVKVSLFEWATGFAEPTDFQFVPGDPSTAWVLEKGGKLFSFNSTTDKRTKLLDLAVLTQSELGLLGVAFHPQFEQSRKFYLNYNPASGKRRTRISEWVLSPEGVPGQERVLLEVEQPYANHNGGQLLFGRDSMLYIGLGDGGFAGDPHNNAQSPGVLLGKMLRIDVDKRTGGKAYGIPSDNPFVGVAKHAPEIWAMGLRNPWRYTWDTEGRLVVADVGQNLWEEVSIVEKGKNYGWRIKEASHCFKPATKCNEKGLVDPFLEYGREDGVSITGGAVYTGAAIQDLKGKYLFGDFGTGRLWAADLPEKGKENLVSKGFYALGQWPLQFSAFAKDPQGEVYVAAFVKGSIFKISPP